MTASERDTLLLTGPGRIEQPAVNQDEDNVSPKVSLAFTPSTNQTLYFNFGEGFNSNFGPVWQWDPSFYIRDTKPTTLRSYELGWKGIFNNGKLSVTTAAFDIEQKDRIVFLSNPAAATDFTAPSTIVTTGQLFSSRGIEATARLRATDSTTVELRGSYVDPEWDELIVNTFFGPLDLSGNQPNGVAETMFYAALEQRFGERFSARLWWEIYDDYAITQDNAFFGGGYDLLNTVLSYQPTAGWLDRVDLSLTNLLDEEYDFIFGGSRTAVTHVVPGVPFQGSPDRLVRFLKLRTTTRRKTDA